MEHNPIPHYNLNENPFADLPDVQARYYEDADILDVHTGDTTGVSETIANGMYIYRNKDDEVSGFCLMDASRVLEPFLDTLRKRSKLTFRDYPMQTAGERRTSGQTERDQS